MMRLLSPVSRSLLVLLILSCMLLASPQTKAVQAQAAKGYTVKYFDAWPANGQIKYIRVVITANSGASAQDLDFYVVGSTSGQSRGTTVSTVVSIRKGDAEAKGELFIPISNGYNFSLHTELDGNLQRDRQDFASRSYYGNQFSKGYTDEATPSMVLVSSEVLTDQSTSFSIMTRPKRPPIDKSVAVSDDFMALDDIESWYENSNAVGSTGKTYMNINGFSSSAFAAMSPESLPSRWFGYEGLGLLVIPFDDLKLMAKQHPGKLLAIERWVAASGRIAVLHCGDQFEKADEVLRLLGEDNISRLAERRTSFPKSSLSQQEIETARVEAANLNQQMINSGAYYNGNVARAEMPSAINQEIATAPLKTAKGKAKDFIAVDFELGQVICVGDTASDWSKQKPSNVDAWGSFGLFLKHTTRQKSDNVLLNHDTVRNFGYPEFAEPPRYVFELSIVAYLLAVGPLAFFVLKQKRKLNLMFVVVPVISSIFCAGILAWAIFAEGFDTRVNQFTFTELNQQSGRQTTSTISHIYSGMTPSAYRFDGPTYGFVNLPRTNRYQRIQWTEDGQEVSGGEVRARTNHQLFTRCSNETTSKLVFNFKGEKASATATVRNDFETQMVCLAFRSDACSQSECWFCSQVDPGAVVKAEKIELKEAASRIRKQIRDRGSQTVYAVARRNAVSNSNSGYNYYYGDEISSVDDLAAANDLNVAWHLAETQLKTLFRNHQDGYFALTQESTNYETAISNAKMNAEIHILQGVR